MKIASDLEVMGPRCGTLEYLVQQYTPFDETWLLLRPRATLRSVLGAHRPRGGAPTPSATPRARRPSQSTPAQVTPAGKGCAEEGGHFPACPTRRISFTCGSSFACALMFHGDWRLRHGDLLVLAREAEAGARARRVGDGGGRGARGRQQWGEAGGILGARSED